MTTDTELDNLKRQLEATQLRAQIRTIEGALRRSDLADRHVGRLPEAWGDTVDRTEFLRDGAGLSNFGDLTRGRVALAADRMDGDNAPFWQSESELSLIRGVARVLATIDEVAIGALDNLTNYCIGTGFTYKATPKEATDPDAAVLAKRVQAVVDRLLDDNQWAQDGEREAFSQSRRDGEVYLALEHRGGPQVEIVPVDPGCVTQPDAGDQLAAYAGLPDVPLSWKYGIATPQNRTHRPLAYFVEWASGTGQDWDLYRSCEMLHIKLNVDRVVKRGLSDYYAIYRNLDRAARLLGNTMEGASVQAAIAYIREHATGTTTDSIQDLVASRADIKKVDPVTGKQRNVAKMRPGTVVDVTAGLKYHAAPLGSPNGPAFIDIVQAGFRVAGIRWTMPEYMISGDASNANFSSTMVAESPFVKATEARQSVYVAAYKRLAMRAVELVATRTTLLGSGMTPRLLWSLVELTVDAPEIAVRDRLEDHTIRKEEHDAGILSLETWAAEAGRDLEAEVRKGAKKAPPPPAPFGTFPGQPPAQQPPTPPNAPEPPQGSPPTQPTTDPATAREAARKALVDDVIARIWAHYP